MAKKKKKKSEKDIIVDAVLAAAERRAEKRAGRFASEHPRGSRLHDIDIENWEFDRLDPSSSYNVIRRNWPGGTQMSPAPSKVREQDFGPWREGRSFYTDDPAYARQKSRRDMPPYPYEGTTAMWPENPDWDFGRQDYRQKYHNIPDQIQSGYSTGREGGVDAIMQRDSIIRPREGPGSNMATVDPEDVRRAVMGDWPPEESVVLPSGKLNNEKIKRDIEEYRRMKESYPNDNEMEEFMRGPVPAEAAPAEGYQAPPAPEWPGLYPSEEPSDPRNESVPAQILKEAYRQETDPRSKPIGISGGKKKRKQ